MILDTMIAFAVLSVVLVSVYTFALNGLRNQTEARQKFEATLMARALLEEYLATYPALKPTGTYHNLYTWSIEETEVDTPIGSAHRDDFRFFRVIVKVTEIANENVDTELSRVVAQASR